MLRLGRYMSLLVLVAAAIFCAGRINVYFRLTDAKGLLVSCVTMVVALVGWVVWVSRGPRKTLRRNADDRLRLARICPVCGYNMRATPDRCSECGYEVTQ